MASGRVFWLLVLIVAVVAVPSAGAQVPSSTPSLVEQSPPTQADVDRLDAIILDLRSKLLVAEFELGQEKARRAKLEMDDLRTELGGARQAVRTLLGLPVSQVAPTQAAPAQKPPTS